jgi:hypothetical protein
MTVNITSQPSNNAILPDTPTSVSASAVAGTSSASAGGASVSFTLSTNPGKGSGNYVATSSPGGFTASAASSPIVFASGVFTAGTAYTFSVIKQSGSGISSATSSSSGSVTAYTVPSAPTITSSSAGNGILDISFTAGASNGSTITNYEYSTDGTNWSAISPANTVSPVRITGLTNGTNYTVRLRAVNSAGSGSSSSPYTDSSTLTTQPYGVPLSPTVSLSNGCTTAAWTFSATANGRDITKYGYQVSTNNGSTWGAEVETASNTYSRDVSTDEASYVVRVRAYNAAGWSASYSSQSSATTARANAGTVQEYYDGSCSTRRLRSKTTYTRSGCSDTYIYGSPYNSPDCGATPTDYSSNSCWTVQSGSGYETLGGQRYLWGSDFLGFEYYVYKVDGSNNLTECGAGFGCATGCCKTYWLYKCGSTYATSYRSCQC